VSVAQSVPSVVTVMLVFGVRTSRAAELEGIDPEGETLPPSYGRPCPIENAIGEAHVAERPARP
jgi:hypothetical protein